MTAAELHAAANELGLAQVEVELGEMIGKSPRTMREWFAERTSIDPSAERLINLILFLRRDHGMSNEDVGALMRGAER